MKDGQPLITDGSSHYLLSQTITDRHSSTYSNVLTVRDGVPGGVTGTYNCTVSNNLGSDSRKVVAAGELLRLLYTKIYDNYNNCQVSLQYLVWIILS